jgi:hypothetical protein
MCDLGPIASAANRRETAGQEITPLIYKKADHVCIAIGIASTHKQILALRRAAIMLRIMFEASGPGEKLGINHRIASQSLVPRKGRHAILPSRLIVGGDHRRAEQLAAASRWPLVDPRKGSGLWIRYRRDWQQKGKTRKERAHHGQSSYPA